MAKALTLMLIVATTGPTPAPITDETQNSASAPLKAAKRFSLNYMGTRTFKVEDLYPGISQGNKFTSVTLVKTGDGTIELADDNKSFIYRAPAWANPKISAPCAFPKPRLIHINYTIGSGKKRRAKRLQLKGEIAIFLKPNGGIPMSQAGCRGMRPAKTDS